MTTTSASLLLPLLLLPFLSNVAVAQDFDFFYFVQQWPGSFCDTAQSCCYPSSGKPATEFGIHGLWPNYNDGSYPSNCDPNTPFVASKIDDLKSKLQASWPSLACPSSNGESFWAHEWAKHGTCSESVFDQHDYFLTALNLKSQYDILSILSSAGIEANGGSYSSSSISEAIKDATGSTPGVECNSDLSGNNQLYQVYLCVDNSGSNFIECPVLPSSHCSDQIQFPSF